MAHTEMFGEVAASALGAYSVSTFSINPGVPAAFPWLSAVAVRYETYKFRKLEFEYYSVCPTSVGGTIGMVFDFDANDLAPQSVMRALTYADAYSNSAWSMGSLKVNLMIGDKMPSRYTRAGVTSSQGTDLKTMDVGNLHIFTDNLTILTTVGRVRVHYVVDLFTPQTDNSVGGSWVNTTGLTTLNMVGSAATWTPDALSVAPFVWNSERQLYFVQPFEGLVSMACVGVALTGVMAFTVAGYGALVSVVASTVSANSATTVAQVRLPYGSLLSCNIGGATSITSVRWSFAAGTYGSYY